MIQYFILGVLTVYIILPIVDSILNIVLALFEVIKGSLTLKVAKYNHAITELETPIKKEKERRIGFLVNDEKEEMEETDSEA